MKPKRFKPKTVAIAAAVGGLLFFSGTVAAGNAAQNALNVASVGNPMTSASAAATPTPEPVEEKPKETFTTAAETEVVPFARTTVEDGALAKGTTQVSQAGVDGTRTRTYRVTLRDGVEVNRKLLSDTVTTAPLDEVTTIGTYVAPPPPPPAPVVAAPPPAPAAGGGCNSAYTGPCVPIASDVDCAGGSGDGPAYVQGPVYIGSSDPYGLDRDGDGIACD